MSRAIINLNKLFSCSRIHNNLKYCTFIGNVNSNVKEHKVPDFLMQNLKNANSADSILEMIKDHSNILNSKHVMQALRSMYDLQKVGNFSNESTKSVIRSAKFDKLCRKLKQQAGVLETNETIEALKVMSFLGVPSDSHIMQVLLQLVRHDINNLSLRHIYFLHFLLNQFKSSPLVEALKIALPLVFEINLPIKLDHDNLPHLVEYFYFASRVKLSRNSIETLVKALESNPKFSEINAQQAKSIVWSICDQQEDFLFENLLKMALNSMIVNFDDLNFTDIETTLSKLVIKYSKKYPFYYDEVFFDSCANDIIDKDLGYKQALHMLRKFTRINHLNRNLIQYTCDRILENANQFISDNNCLEIYSIVVNLALSEFKPPNYEALKDLILGKCKNLASYQGKDVIWLKFASSLCLLNIFKVDVLNKVLNKDYLQNIFRKRYMSDYEHYLTIWNAIKLYKPEFDEILLDDFHPLKLVNSLKPIPDFPLQDALLSITGGSDFILNDLKSKMGHKIDHVIALKKDGHPSIIVSEAEFIEDLENTAENRLVLIIVLRSIDYTLNCKSLRLAKIFALEALKKSGFNVVAISEEAWQNLNDFERIPYLIQQIKNNFSDFEVHAQNKATGSIEF